MPQSSFGRPFWLQSEGWYVQPNQALFNTAQQWVGTVPAIENFTVSEPETFAASFPFCSEGRSLGGLFDAGRGQGSVGLRVEYRAGSHIAAIPRHEAHAQVV